MTRKITSINEMCQCPKQACHSTFNIERCIAYGPITLYHRDLKKDQEGYEIRACEFCAIDLMTENYSILEPETL